MTASQVQVPTRRFGATELAMPVFTCGGMRFQQSWEDQPWSEIRPESQRNLEATIQRALELGIRHIETARGYGTSEVQLGFVLEKIPREAYLLQTKVAPMTAEKFRETFATSLRNLRTEFVDLLSIHGINNRELLDLTLQRGGALEAARQIQREGRTRFVGFSTHAPLPIILEAIRTGEFAYINLHWYWIFQENEPAIAEAKKYDMGVFIISPNDKGGKLYAPSEKLRELCAPYHPMVFNNLFCLADERVHTLSIGAARPSDFEEHLQTVPLLGRAKEIAQEIDQKLQKQAIAELGEEWWRNYLEGVPEWEEIPGQVNVRVILRLWTLYRAFGMLDYAQMRYNLLGNASHWFPGRNAAEIDDQKIQKALQGSPFYGEIPGILREAHRLFFRAPTKRLGRD